jgi:nitrous-oxide reductase
VPVGPLHPQNHQLIDISNDKMQLLYDMPLPLGEPHYVVAIEATKLKPGVRYKVGTDPHRQAAPGHAVRAGEEETEKKGNKITVYGTLIRSHITPETIEAEVGDEVTIHLTNLERAQDETHGFTVDLQRACLGRAGQDRHGQVQGRQGRRLSVLLHGVLLGAAP